MIFLYLFRLLCDFSFQFIDMMNYITWFFRRFYLFTFGCGWVFFQLWSAGATLHCGAQAFSLQWLLVTEHGLWVQGLQQLQHAGSVVAACWLSSWQPAGSRALAQLLRHTGFIAPWQVGSSWTSGQIDIPCIARCTLQPLDHQGSPFD